VLHEGRIALAVLDLGLPDGSGLELLRELRSTSRLPVIVVSGRDAEADRVAGLEVPTTIWSSPSRSGSWWPVSGPCCAARGG
jgi:DNA-binding response OmpR family regulator